MADAGHDLAGDGGRGREEVLMAALGGVINAATDALLMSTSHPRRGGTSTVQS